MLRLKVPNMTCGGCARSVTAALTRVDPYARIETEPAVREVRIETSVSASVIRTALAEAGFPVDDRPAEAA
ncbi:heavy-metal-associated domain-containing protein [Methylobacterium sp. sgz302541]|uniref:heavy-metal-associated domain-containing protein n=1 Tax=unclassified Methylobacterium TaxID=2615210 RepID=UPI003D34D070